MWTNGNKDFVNYLLMKLICELKCVDLSQKSKGKYKKAIIVQSIGFLSSL